MTDLPVSETKRTNQYHPDVIARREEESRKLAEAAEEKKKQQMDQLKAIMTQNRIVYFNCGKARHPDFPEVREPNPLQKKLLAAWEDDAYKVFTYLGANRIGKCVTYQTLIETTSGEVSVGELFERGEPFEVWAYDERANRRIAAKAKAPFKKEGLHKCYRITMSDGRWIEAADHHRILCSDGQYRTVAMLASLFPSSSPHTSCGDQPLSVDSLCLQDSSSAHDLSVPYEGGQRLSGTLQDSQGRYSEDYRQCGEQPHVSQDSVPTWIPSRDGVQQYSYHGCDLDVCGCEHSDSPSCTSLPLSSQGVGLRYEGQSVESLSPSSCSSVPPRSCLSQGSPLHVFESPFEVLSNSATCLTSLQEYDYTDTQICSPSQPPLYLCSNNIVCITAIASSQEVYDFEVEIYHNYFAGGLVHHNTTIGAIIAIATLYGEWPWSGRKLKFRHNLPRRVLYVGQGWENHIKTVVEPALKFWWPDVMPLKTKKNNQGIDATWEYWSRSHDKGLQGSLMIMSTSQAVEVFEGAQYDLVVYDEPPPRDIRVACARGLVDRHGRELFCCTLLNQAWVHREVIKAKLPDGSTDLSVFNLSGDSSVNIGYGITQEGIDQFAKTLTHDEYQARILGKPSYLSTLVCPKFDTHIHVKERFKIPLDALITISIDFHPSKPWYATFMAHTKQGFKYICEEIVFRGNPKSFAEEVVRVIRLRDYARIERVIIDPLSKSGQDNDIDTYSIVEETIAPYGYSLETASKDKDNGISILNGLLWTDNEMPALFFFRDCVKSIQQVEDLMYDAETFKPSKVDDDAFETIYRHCLLGIEWYPAWDSGRVPQKAVVL